MSIPKRILPIIVIAQFCCTSLWFAGNGVMNDLVQAFNLSPDSLSNLTSAVQLGFIAGTLVFALLTIADRYSPSRVFLVSAIFGAIFNLGTVLESNGLMSLLIFRFMTGFCLAGIYPVGMKIAADYYDKSLGKSLGLLVGALVLGTALPHLLKVFTTELPWKLVLISTSSLATIGGLLIVVLVPDGPYRQASEKLNLNSLFSVFRNQNFRAAAFGYFGHMWELYTFWTFVPVMLLTYNNIHPDVAFNIPLLSFLIIGLGSVASVIGGYLSQIFGAKKIAFIALMLSGLCCVISPTMYFVNSDVVFVGFLIFWGLVVIADSPLFSTLVAQSAAAESKGTALTIVNSIGFSITIVSIQFINLLTDVIRPEYLFVALAIGPVLGLIALTQNEKKK